jgi:hypothetical protein
MAAKTSRLSRRNFVENSARALGALGVAGLATEVRGAASPADIPQPTMT